MPALAAHHDPAVGLDDHRLAVKTGSRRESGLTELAVDRAVGTKTGDWGVWRVAAVFEPGDDHAAVGCNADRDAPADRCVERNASSLPKRRIADPGGQDASDTRPPAALID